MKIAAVTIYRLDTTAVFLDGEALIVGHDGADLDFIQQMAEGIGAEFEAHEVEGAAWDQYEDVPATLADTLRIGGEEPAKPVSTNEEF